MTLAHTLVCIFRLWVRERTKGEGVAREGPRGHTAARGRGRAATGEGLRSSGATLLSGASAGLAAVVPVGTSVPERQENLPVAYAPRGLHQHSTVMRCIVQKLPVICLPHRGVAGVA